MVKRIALALAVFVVWFLIGGFMWLVLYSSIAMAMLGGNATPPLLWRMSRDFGVFVLPVIMTLGGVPAAAQILRGNPVTKAVGIAAVVCFLAWLGTWFMVFAAPDVFGWWW